MKPRIVLIHAVTAAIEPVQQAFRERWPEAECANLLDDSLSPDRARDAELTSAMRDRIGALADYAALAGADGILFTCSAFGAAIDAAAARFDIPVLKPNEAMFEAALNVGDRIGMIATFTPAVPGMEEEFREIAQQRGRPSATIRTVCVPEAMSALRSGDAGAHNRFVAGAASQLRDCDAVMLAHFSTARAEVAVRTVLGGRVYTSPAAAVSKLKDLLEPAGWSDRRFGRSNR